MDSRIDTYVYFDVHKVIFTSCTGLIHTKEHWNRRTALPVDPLITTGILRVP